MAECDDDRQLTEAQRQAGYQNQRTGVRQALRPFSGRATLPNLLDYINRELVPAVRSTRSAVNDIYLPVVDNAPSANPLQYYFSTDTTNADPTTGFVRLDASPQNTATTVRVSETNARLGDATPWLEVMAGGATTPLGVVTLSDAVNPARFLRFDLETMTDQGTYWDLGVTAIESSHDDPFVDGGGLVMSFIPGVASDGVTVPPGSLTPIAAQSVLGNPTSSPAAPVAIALNDLSVLGRAGVLGTNVAGIDVPGTGTFTGESVFLRVASTRLAIQWRPWTLVDMPQIDTNKFVGNVSGATARPAYTDIAQLGQDLFGIGFDTATHNFKLTDILTDHFLGNITGATTTPIPTPLSSIDSTSIVYDGTSHTFQRAALTGDVTASQDSNTVTVNANAVTDAKLRDSGPLSVIGRAANSTGDPADISAVAASGAVLRESGSTLGFGTIATAGIADDAVSNAKLANMAQATIKGRASGAGTGDPQDLTGAQAGQIVRFSGQEDGSTAAGTFEPTLLATTSIYRINPAGNFDVTFTGFAFADGNAGHVFLLLKQGTDGRCILQHNVGVTAANGAFTPDQEDLVLTAANECALLWYQTSASRWNAVVGKVNDGDKGDITVTLGGTTWTIDNDVVSDAKLRNSSALSVIGRSANSTGDPADISAVAASGAVLRESGSTLGFGTVATAGLADDSVTNAKIRDSGALSVIGRSANSAGDPADISATAASGAVLRESGSVLGFGTIATAGLADDVVTNAKLANMAAGTVKGRQIDAGTGDPVDLTGAEVAEIIRFPNRVTESVGGTLNDYALDQLADTLSITANATLSGIVHTGTGKRIIVANGGGLGSGIVVEILHFSSSSTGGNRIALPKGTTLRLYPGDGVELQHDVTGNFWFTTAGVKPYYRTNSSGLGASRGRINFVNGTSVGWTNADVSADDEVTITPNVIADSISNTLLRNSAAVSVIGRAANSAGDPADIAAAANDRLLARTSDSLAFQQLTDGMVPTNTLALTKLANILDNRWLGNVSGATGAVVANDLATFNSTTIIYESTGKTFIRQALTGDVTASQNSNATTITNGAVTNAKLRNSDSLSVIGNPTNASTVPSDIAAANDGEVLRRSGTSLGFGTVATAGIANDAVTDGKLRNSGALSVIGRSANSTGDPADISAVAASGAVLRESGSTLGFGTIATAGITDAAVTLAKMANLAQSTIIGRAEGAGTGVPTALTPTQVMSIVDGESVTWTGTHAFNGTTLSAGTSSNITLSSGATFTLSASTVVQVTSPTRLASTLAFDSVLANSSTGAVNDLAIGTVSTVRFTGPPATFTGMVALAAGQVVLLVNAAATDVPLFNESVSSSAANRFAGVGTSRQIKPGEMALCWYDGTSSRWRVLCRDDVDL